MQENISPKSNESLDEILKRISSGKLRDAGAGSEKFRDHLRKMDLIALENILIQDLRSPSDGRALQDIINILGARLGFNVEHGLYAGKKGKIGFDGLWEFDGNYIVIECKKTDSYRISTRTLLDYSEKIRIERGLEQEIPILLIVGRIDVGDLEAQIRGSRNDHLFSIIGAEALLEIVKVSESLPGGPASRKIPSLLFPKDHTRLDNLINFVKGLVGELEQTEINRASSGKDNQNTQAWGPNISDLSLIREKMVAKVSAKSGELKKIASPKNVLYVDKKNGLFVFLVSKKYENSITEYWFSLHPEWKKKWQTGIGGLVMGCEGLEKFVFIEAEDLIYLINGLNRDLNKPNSSWNILIERKNTEYFINLPKYGKTFSLEKNMIKYEN